VGITLLFWLAGAVYTIAGAHLNIEFGLSTPRHTFRGREQGIPRSGGTLNYASLFMYRIQRNLLITHSYNMFSPGRHTAPKLKPYSSSLVCSRLHILFLETWQETV
jgi:hypothetical protein